MARSDGASYPGEATGIPPLWDAQRQRYSRQIWSLQLASWLGALATRAVNASSFVRIFPSAHDGPRSPGSPVRTEHALTGTGATPLEWRALVDQTSQQDITGVELLLPRPGDPRGVTSIELLDRSQQAGSAIRIQTAQVSTIVIPQGVHEHLMTWSIGSEEMAGTPPVSPLSLAQADRELRAAILEAENAIVELGLRAGPPQARDLLESAQQELAQATLPDSVGPARRSLLMRAAPISWMCSLALDEDSVAITRADLHERREALRNLDRVARHAMEAAASHSRTL